MQHADVAPEGAEEVHEEVHEGTKFQQATFVGAPLVAAAPARVNVSPELFAKLAAGGQLTPEEMAQLSGQPAPEHQQPATPEEQQALEAAGAATEAVGTQPEAAPGSAKATKA